MGNIRCFSFFIAYVLVCSIFISLTNAQAEVEDDSALSYGRKTEQAWEDGMLQSPIDRKDEEVLILPTLDDLRRKHKPSLAKDLEEEDESGFSYDWGAPNGPQNWGNLNPNWTTCGTGKSQSPISILDNINVVLWPSPGNLTRRYKPASAIIQNKGHDIQVTWTEDAGGIIINGDEFKLVQCHWHIPSEHKVNGVRYNMELHLVHSNSQNELAVIGILYKLGKPDPFLSMLSPFPGPADRNGTDLGVVNPYDIGFKVQKYYRYNGSLTTPPCSENVNWTVLKTVKTVSPKQIQELRDAVNDYTCTGNARPIQQLNGRNVYLFRQRSWIASW